MSKAKVEVRKMGREDALLALPIVEEVYCREKGWIPGVAREMIEGEMRDEGRHSWFIAEYDGKPAGLLRLQYDPELSIPPEFEPVFEPGFDPSLLSSRGRYAEIGRFMILREYRGKIMVALRLMRAAVAETVERGYTHFITDVFEGEATSPYNFHTRVLGFEVVGKHLKGELNCSCTRIILTLDILKAWARIKRTRRGAAALPAPGGAMMGITEGIEELLDRKLAEREGETGAA